MDAYALSKVQLFKERTIIVFVRLELTSRMILFVFYSFSELRAIGNVK